MVSFEDYHFNLNRILLLAIGLWPYEQSKFARFQYIFFSVILMEAIIFQVKKFLTENYLHDVTIVIMINIIYIILHYIELVSNDCSIFVI
jgi:hypothetical protein